MACVILVTGATGFVGGATVAELLANEGVDDLLLLVRAADAAEARARVARSVGRFGRELGLDRVAIVVGDLERSNWHADARLDDATHVLHAAAVTSFRSSIRSTKTNVDGTLALARRMQRAPRLRRFLHVGTAYCCGPSAVSIVREDDGPGTEHPNAYARSKADAERALCAMPDLPLLVARPSVVAGHTTLGCAPSASMFWYYRALARLGVAPFAPDRLRDIVPVDHVARALRVLLFASAPKHAVVHVSAGVTASRPWSAIAAAFARHEPSLEATPRYASVQEIVEPARLHAAFGPGDHARLARGIVACAAFASLAVACFANDRLEEMGVPAPPPFTEYLEACMTTPPSRSVLAQFDDDA